MGAWSFPGAPIPAAWRFREAVPPAQPGGKRGGGKLSESGVPAQTVDDVRHNDGRSRRGGTVVPSPAPWEGAAEYGGLLEFEVLEALGVLEAGLLTRLA